MTTAAVQRPRIETPCMKLCKIDQASQLCSGCLRSIDEIMAWKKMTSVERQSVMALLSQRSLVTPTA
jgi:uncharacterized protein